MGATSKSVISTGGEGECDDGKKKGKEDMRPKIVGLKRPDNVIQYGFKSL